MINGIDVSDPTRNFTAQEWETLGPTNHAILLELHNHDSGQGQGAGGWGHSRGRGRSDDDHSANISAVTFDTDTQMQATGQSKGTHSNCGGRNGQGFGHHGAYGSQHQV